MYAVDVSVLVCYNDQVILLLVTTYIVWGEGSRSLIKIKKWPGNLSEFKLLTSAALQLAVSIRFQNTSRDSCSISIAS